LYIKLQPHRLHLVTVTLPVYVYVCQGMTTPVHSIHYSLQRLLQIMCTNCKKKSVLSATPGKQTSGRKYCNFPFAAYTTTKLRAGVSPNSFPFLTTLQANATKHKLREVRLRCLVYTVVCRLSYRLWSLADRYVERSATALF